MAECRACLAKNVRMHLITNTRYREMYEKLSGNKLSIEDGRPETICYICHHQLQRFWRFFEMSQKTEKMLTTRLLFGIEMQGDMSMHSLSMTAVKAVSLTDEEPAAPEVTVTVKEELDDVEEWESFKKEFMDSDYENDENEPIDIPQTENTIITSQDKEKTNITKLFENAKERDTSNIKNLENAVEKELKNMLDFIKTETIESTETINEEISKIQNLQQFSLKTEDYINENTIKNPENFPVKADMRYHMPKLKSDTYYYCNKCEYRCQQSKTLRKHNKHHDPQNQFACAFCLYRFPDELKLIRHKNYCTVCNICGKKFHNLNGLRIHVRLHTGEQPFSCDLCGRGFNQKTNLQTHLRVHAREKQYPCEICHKIFPFSGYLKRHMLIHSEKHIDGESMHRIQNCHKLFSTRKKKVMSSCTVCGKTLRKDSIAMHMRLHTGEQPFSCEKCHRFFNQKCNLLTHVERCHPGDELFACKVCFKTFAMNSELRKHMVTHGVKVEIKKELIAQTEQTIKNFISRYEKEVEQRMEVLTEADKKMELILNLGLKPRVINSQEPNGLIAIPDSNKEGNNIKATKRKRSSLDPGIKKAKKKAREITTLRDPIDGIIKGIKIEGLSPNNTKVNIEESNSVAENIKRENIIHEDKLIPDDKENYLANSVNENVTCIDVSQELQGSDSKTLEPLCDSKNTEKSNSLATEDSSESNSIFVATSTNIDKDCNESIQNIKEVEIKQELINENELLLEYVDKDTTKPKETINLSDDVINENVIAEEVSIKKEVGDFEYCKEINSDDIEYFDDSIEIVEVEISDSEEYSNVTEQSPENKEIAFNNEDLEVSAINTNQNASAEEKTALNEDLAIEKLNGSQALLSDVNDHRNEDVRGQNTYTGVEVSVIDPDDVNDSEDAIEEEYLDLSDDESFNEDARSDVSIDFNDAEDKFNINNTPKRNPCNEPRIKLRRDLFGHSEDNFFHNLNREDIETNNLSKDNSENMLTKANKSIANNNDSGIIAIENTLDDFTSTEYLDSDYNEDNLDTPTNEYNFDNIASTEVNFDDLSDTEDRSSDSYDETPISVKDFDVFQQKNIISVHRAMNNIPTPYPCDLCVTKVFSY